MRKRTTNSLEASYPLVNVQRFQSLKCEVDKRQLEELAEYIRYVETVSSAGEKPTEGEVVGVALAELFKLDRGFQDWKESQESHGARHRTPASQPTGD
jgi:hypothetical protein